VKDSRHHDGGVDRGGNKPKHAQSEQKMKHRRDTDHLNQQEFAVS
jgi:hypothetical protein